MIDKNKELIFSVEKIINSGWQMKIPNFQRAYTWEAYEVDTLINDLYDNAMTGEYFMGTIYLVSGKSNDRYIIDGQQRITTLFLILNSFRLLYPNTFSNDNLSPINKILDTYEGSPEFVELFDLENISDIDKLIRTRGSMNLSAAQIILNQRHIITTIKEKNTNNDPKELYQSVLKNVIFIFLHVDTIKSGHVIFENLNSKGVDLSNFEIIKNGFFSRIEDKNHSPFTSPKYKYWKEIEENIIPTERIDQRTISSVRNIGYSNMDNMFKFYAQCVLRVQSIPKSRYQVASRLIKYIDDNEDYLEDLRVIRNYSRAAKYVFYPKEHVHSYQTSRELNKYIRYLDTIKIKQHVPFSISVMMRVINNSRSITRSDIAVLYNKLVLFHYLFNTISSEIPSKITKMYTGASVKIFANESLKNILPDLYEHMEQNIPNQSTVKEEIKNIVFYFDDKVKALVKNSRKHYKTYDGKYYGANIFELIETFKSGENTTKNIESIEHILNQNVDFCANFTNFKLYSMIPLEEKLNNKCKNGTIAEKLEYYQKSSYYLANEFVNHYKSIKHIDGMNDKNIVSLWKDRFVEIIYKIYESL